MQNDIEIAHSYQMDTIDTIANKISLLESDIECYGKYKAKIISKIKDNKRGKLILVTAITPTQAGEGKTTVSIGIADALNLLGKKATLALREPSLGPVFGLKGGACGGGRAQIVPMEDINLHFTGDFHAVSAANNLIAAMLDNSIVHDNPLNIDLRTITFKRCVDMNDRQLRHIVSGLGGRINGMPREGGFEITTASEIMALLCLATDLDDLKTRISRLVVAKTFDGKEITVKDLKAEEAATILLKDAIKPNLVQTLYKTPAFVHGGPFANIAHGCNSIAATRISLSLSDYTITEAGFGADLGAEKFIDIKCRELGTLPDAVVLVASIRALKSHGGVKKEDLNKENIEALKEGLKNLERHMDNITSVWHLPLLVTINHFPTDRDTEIEVVKDFVTSKGVQFSISTMWEKGAEGGLESAEKLLSLVEEKTKGEFTYTLSDSLADKIRAIAKRIYRANEVVFAPGVITKLRSAERDGYRNFPICMAKTQYSFSDDAKKLNAPTAFNITIKDIKVASGAGFVIAYAGDIITMPGLPKVPAAEAMKIDSEGSISGLF